MGMLSLFRGGVFPGQDVYYRKGLIVPVLALLLSAGTGCGVQPSKGDSNVGTNRQALAWSGGVQGIDSGSGLAFTPRIAVENDPVNNGGADDNAGSAMAVWVERVDIDASDLLPAVYHLYAKRAVGGTWDSADSGCPFGFPFDIQNDGVCLIDNGSLSYDVWGPKVVMDAVGNAAVIWQEYSSAAGRTRVYVRRYIMGAGWEGAATAVDAPAMGDAVNPDIAIEPDGGGTAFAVWSQYWPDPNTTDWRLSYDGGQSAILALEDYNGLLFAGQGTGAGVGDVLRFNGTTWTTSYDGASAEISALVNYNSRLYAGQGNAAGNGDILVFNGSAWAVALDLGAESFLSFAELNGLLYAGQGSSPGNGVVYVCNPRRVDNESLIPDPQDEVACLNNGSGNDWIAAYTSGADRIESLAGYNGRLYAGLGTQTSGSGAGDIWVCNPAVGGNPAECEPGEWVLSYDGSQESILSLEEFNGLLYAGQGIDAADGDILVCNPAAFGDPLQCDPGDWGVALDSNVNRILALQVYDGTFFAGQGGATAGDGDVLRCFPGSDGRCDPGDWAASLAGGQEAVNALGVYLDGLYAGQGTDITDGDVYQFSFSVGWHTMTRRLTPAGWAATDSVTGCVTGVLNPDDGICDIDGGSRVTSHPQVGMDDAGRAISIFIRFDPLDCDQSVAQDFGSGAGGGPVRFTGRDDPSNTIRIVCRASRVYAARFDLTTWGSHTNLTPVQNILDNTPGVGAGNPPINQNCEDYGNTFGGKGETSNGSSACLAVSELKLAVDGAGNALAGFKISERATLTNAEISNVAQQAPADLLDVHERKAIFVRRYTSGSTWSLAATLGITDYEYSPRVDNAVLINDCASFNASDTEDFVGVMNCDLTGLALAMKPNDGTRAMAAYQRFNGTARDIVVHRNNGTAFGSVTDADDCTNAVGTCWHNVDAGAGEAKSPSLAMDNNGNGLLVWTQKDPSGVWHVYANRCAENSGSCLWGGPEVIDSRTAGEKYFEPHTAMESINANNSVAADCGGTGGAGCGNAFTIFNVMNALFHLRMDVNRWTPP